MCVHNRTCTHTHYLCGFRDSVAEVAVSCTALRAHTHTAMHCSVGYERFQICHIQTHALLHLSFPCLHPLAVYRQMRRSTSSCKRSVASPSFPSLVPSPVSETALLQFVTGGEWASLLLLRRNMCVFPSSIHSHALSHVCASRSRVSLVTL